MSTNKSFSTETSERYSRALFEVSNESNELDKTESDIKIFKSLINSSSEIQNFVKDPTQSIEQQKKVISVLSENLKFSKNLQNFFLLLIEKRRIFFVTKIFESFLKLCSKKRGEFKASLRIELFNHQGTLATLTNTISGCDSNIIGLQTEEKESNIYFIDLELTTHNRVHLARVMKKIRTMPEVQKVSRHSQSRH